MSKNIKNEFHKILLEQFRSRKDNNPRYSIRAFALYLGIDQSGLTKTLAGKKQVSVQSMRKCLKSLGYQDFEIDNIVRTSSSKKKFYKNISEDAFEIISDWHHFAILELFSLDNKISIEYIASSLEITQKEAELCLNRLLEYGFVKLTKKGYITGNPNNTWFNNKSTSESRKKLQHDLLVLSKTALEDVPFELRDHGAMTVAINRDDMPEIKAILSETRRKLAKVFQKNTNFNEVYQLTMSFFPLTNNWK